MEQGAEVLTLVDYVMRRDRVEFIQAVRTLANVAGLQLPHNKPFDVESYHKYKDRATALEDANSYFMYCLKQIPLTEEVRGYLNSRGYSNDDIEDMELGYIPSQEKLFKYLTETKGYTPELVGDTLNINTDTRIGTTHRLTIPYRSGGAIKGFKFRTIGDTAPKYLNSKGLDKMSGFFNLLGIKGDKDIVIVEGELDSLHATVKGIPNVVATGGSSISLDQIKDAKRRGAKSFTICLDNEPGKEEDTAKKIDAAIEVVLREGSRLYIATLPDLGNGKTDPDRLIKEDGVGAFKEAISNALPYYQYKLQATLHKFGAIQTERGGELTDRDIDNLLEEVVETATKIKEPVDRDRYKKLFISLDPIKELGISEESLTITVDRLTSTREKEAQAKELNALLNNAKLLQDKGEVKEALELLDKQGKQIKTTTGKSLLPPALSYESLLADIADTPPAFKTGYSSLDKFIGFTPGAITLVGGRPSHGKTTFMFNLLLEMAKLYTNDGYKFYFFTYEEPTKNIAVKLINRLTAVDLSGYFRQYENLAKPTNYEFIKAYLKDQRTDISELEKAKNEFRELVDGGRITVIDKNYSVEELSSLIAYLNSKEQIGGVFIDYIQRMRTDRRTQDKRTEIAHISDQVLQIAKENGLPLILGAQLNRSSAQTGTKKPTLESLKEAGNLEEDANTVLSVYNESREKEETEDGQEYKTLREVDLEIKALKNREGSVNEKATLIFDKYTGVVKDRPSDILA